MKRQFYILILLLFTDTYLFAQSELVRINGKVTFITSENIYVRFNDASVIKTGDTLMLAVGDSLIPCLRVTHTSSISCVTSAINNCEVQKDMMVVFEKKIEKTEDKFIEKTAAKTDTTGSSSDKPHKDKTLPTGTITNRQRINAHFSAASYSNISPDDGNSSHRFAERVGFDIDHISGSRFSFESYMNYNQIVSEPKGERINENFPRVYDLALNYIIDDNLHVTLGRKINRHFASVGAIDGLQVEKIFKQVSVGAIAGSRPDFDNYGYNPNLLEFGGFVGFNYLGKSVRTENTIGLIEQKNNGNTDRRYAYLQHYSSFNHNLFLFASSELDLYSGNVDSISSKARLTNLYFSTRYRLNKHWTFMSSIDNRKQVIYYETYQASIEQILRNDLPTQGFRLRANFTNKKLFGGAGYNIRIREQKLSSTSINGYLSYRKLPVVKGTLSAYYAFNQSSYLTYHSVSLSLRNDIVRNTLQGFYYYRYNTYKSISEISIFKNKFYAGTRFSYKIGKTLSLDLLGEVAFGEGQVEVYRINTRLIKRFYK